MVRDPQGVTIWGLLGSGLLAGLGVAMPLGAIGLLLLVEGMERGLLRGLPGALGVAGVDTAYAGLALIGGSAAAPLIHSWGAWPAIVGGLVLLTISVRGWLKAGQETRPGPPRNSAAARFGLFFGLTAINPMTLIYFAAISTGLGPRLAGAGANLAFVLGVAAGSAAWQVCLVGVGARLGAQVSTTTQRRLSRAGALLVAVLGLLLLGGALVG